MGYFEDYDGDASELLAENIYARGVEEGFYEDELDVYRAFVAESISCVIQNLIETY